MKARKIFLLAFIILFYHAFAIAEQTDEEKRRDVLRYGLEPEVVELVQNMQDANDSGYTSELKDLFLKTKSIPVRIRILSLFSAQKNDALKEYSLSLLTDPYDAQKEIVVQVLDYVANLDFKEAAPSVRKILENDNKDFRDNAIKTLGKIGSAEDALYLVNYMDSEISGDEKQRLIIRQNIMAALVDMKAVEIKDKITEIAKNADENVMIRASAITAIGKMGNSDDVPLLSSMYESTDPILRTAAISGLAGINTPDSVAVILESFKDSYYKVRLEALSASDKQNLTEAIPYILYRAKTDPVDQVKMKAFEVLAKFNDSDSRKWLSSLVSDEKAPDNIRVKAAAVLAENCFDYVFPDLEKAAMLSLADDKKTTLRYGLGKILAKTESSKTEAIAAAFLASKDTLTKSIGLDLYVKNKYASLGKTVEGIAADEKLGALQRRAKKILGK